MSPTRIRPPRLPRPASALAFALALLLVATAAPVSARPTAPAAAPGPAEAADGDAPARPVDDLASIHYEHALLHADDVIPFEPGGRVALGFSPDPADRWEVGGGPPRGLPAGNATGLQMREAPQGSIWAAGEPGRSGDAPGRGVGGAVEGDPGDSPSDAPGDGLDSTVDQPAGPVDATADPTRARIGGPSTERGVEAAPVGPTGLRREVFGFLPYWELSDSSTVLDWRVLSTVAYFSVGCRANGDLAKRNPDGSLTTGWAGWTSSKMTSVITAAHQHQARVVLTVTCFAWSGANAQVQAALLGSSAARANLARQIAAAVRDRGADGVNLDFEPIVAGYADEFTALVRRVRTELNNVAPGYQLTFDTTGSIGNQPIADATAPGGADAIFIMGYDYRTAGAGYAGSIDPLTGPPYDLTDTLKAYTAKVSPSKLILGVPWYGRAWSTESDRLHARTLSQAKYGASAAPPYSQAIAFALDHGRRWDSVEQAPWTAYRKQTCTTAYGCVTSWRQLYYDDAASLKLRYDLVNRSSLRGVGIWALGYDGTRSELRTALADKFLVDRTPPLAGVVTLPQGQRDEAFQVSWKAWDDSSIRGYDVDVSVDGSAWSRWLTGTARTSSLYLGRDGGTYAFRVRATDSVGNLSAWKVTSVGGVAIPADLAPGMFGTVVSDGLRLRSSASTGATVMTTLAAGDALQVIGGPTVAEGYTWFQVDGPIRQWGQVDPMQVGGWVAAFGNGATNVVPRRPVFATRVDAGITGLRLEDGGQRVLVPGATGAAGRLHLAWVNQVELDALVLRVLRLDGSTVGAVDVPATGAGARTFDWDGRVNGALVPNGAYVVQLRGTRGSLTYNAPAADPLQAGLPGRVGVMIWPAAPTAVKSFRSTPASPTTAGDLTFSLTFGGPVRGLSWSDFVRSGTATGCKVRTPVGGDTTWTIPVTGCSAGTVVLTVKARAVGDAVSNLGPTAAVSATVVIDRRAPTTSVPKLRLSANTTLQSASVGLPAVLSWSGSDTGGAGVRDYDVRRSVDGGPFRDVAIDRTTTSLGLALPAGHSYRFQVRARDRAGNVGAWVAGPTYRAGLTHETSPAIAWSGWWRSSSSPGYAGGGSRYATLAGAAAKYTFTGRGIAIVTTLGPDRGAFKVYVDGSYVATIDSHAAALSYRRVVFARGWGSSGVHTIRIVALGTSGHPRIDLDAFEILR